MKKSEEKAPEVQEEKVLEVQEEKVLEVQEEKAPEEKAPEEKAPDVTIPDTTKLDLEVPNVVFYKVNKPIGATAYKLLEDRVDAINQKHSDKLTVILVPFSVDAELE